MRIFRPQSAACRSIVPVLLVSAIAVRSPALGQTVPVVPVRVIYDTPGSLDEDDMCYWVHPTDPSLSTVIVTDKFAGKIYVYDLDGRLLQELPSPSPRNADTRYGVPFQSTCIDVVALTDRTEDIIRVYSVDRATRRLTRIDDGLIYTHDNYGFTLYQNSDGHLWGITGDRYSGLMRQFALIENGAGRMSGYETSWTFHETRVEGVVADDETGYYYIGEESVGIWRVGVFDHNDRTMIARVGDATGLEGDIEGLALYYAAAGEGYLIASSQGDNKFTVIDRKAPHRGRGNFRVEGVRLTDGIDVLSMSLNSTYSKGIFTAHTGGSTCCSIRGVAWADIASALGLVMDTGYWDPRNRCDPVLPGPALHTLLPAADAPVSESQPSTNLRASTTLRVKSQAGASLQSFLRFDLSHLGSAATSARLRLFCTDASNSGGTLYTRISNSWSEAGITWANRPALASPLRTLGAVAAGTWVELDVSSAVTEPGLYGFALAGGSTNTALYSSREGANPPELVVTTGTKTGTNTGRLTAPVAAFTGSPLAGTAPLAVAFSDRSSGGPTSWSWSFGDGTTSSERNPRHVYASQGSFTVTLTVSDSNVSSSITKTDLVKVGPLVSVRTFLPTADARVNEGSPSSTTGTDVALRVRAQAGGSYHSYLRFDLTGLSTPVASAKLRLYCTDGSDVGGRAFSTSGGWSETGITWSNKPAATGAQLASLGTVASNAWVELDVSSAVTAGSVVNLLLTSTSSNSAYFSSREGSNPPQLIVTSTNP